MPPMKTAKNGKTPEKSCCKCPCRWIMGLLLAAAGVLLVLVNLEIIGGTFAEMVMTWWPAALVLFGISQLCPCHGGCGSCKV